MPLRRRSTMRRSSDPDVIERYAADESNTFFAEGVEAVVFPEHEADVAEVLRAASASRTPVTVSGGGTGLTGARVATGGGIIMTMELMRHAEGRNGFGTVSGTHGGLEYTLAVDAAGERAWCPPAITLDALEALLAPSLLFPPAPTERSAMIGGAVAENASGARSFMHGATREWIEALEIALPTGDTLHISRDDVTADARVLRFASREGTQYTVSAPSYAMPDTKNAAGLFAADGMDLVDLFVGSEGLLGVVTAVLVRLTPRPTLYSDTAFFGSEEEALACADRLREAARAGLPLLSVEFYDPGALRFMADHPQVKPEHEAAIFTELDADDPDTVEAFAEIVMETDPLDDWFADTDREREAQRDFRHSLPESVNTWLRARGTDKLCTDYAVPEEAFPAMMDAYHEACDSFLQVTGRPDSSAVLFGHIGNHHLHIDFLPADATEEDASMEQYAILAQRAIELGGTITAEHGVGKKTLPIRGRRVPYLEVMYGPEGLEEIARTKLAVDPEAILNRGNMVPAQLLDELRKDS
ncbi:MAG: FAD-binding protein [Armatimonadia bacterium]|nr:FAD-binding protein [Armatimonadia bacterium]